MNPKIESIHIRGFRSLADVHISNMSNATVLIGANGSGKSNFIRFFEMLRWMIYSRLGEFVAIQGGADANCLPRMESEIRIRTDVTLNDYGFALAYAHPDLFILTDERCRNTGNNYSELTQWLPLGSGHLEANIVVAAYSQETGNISERITKLTTSLITNLLRTIAIYQFHDTSDTSNFKKRWDLSDNLVLRANGGNLATILYRLERQDVRRYNLICRQISRVLPGFDRFELADEYGKVLLRWKAKWSDKTIGAHLTSDGSLRLFALVTLLNLPPEMLPSIILLDEPEPGLHPAAISLIGGMIKSLSTERQIILATQFPVPIAGRHQRQHRNRPQQTPQFANA